MSTDPESLRQSAARKVGRLRPGNHALRFNVGECRIDARIRIVPHAKVLLVNFHGAYRGNLRTPPIFAGFFRDIPDVHQISVADPSILACPGSSIAWYAGHEGFDTQAVLTEVLKGVIAGLSKPRVVLFGGSGGGFAALYFGHCIENSVAVAVNPQTNILKYSPRLVRGYREACWPGMHDNAQLADVTRTDLTQMYRAGFRNSVVYLQSMGDRAHSCLHMMPFLGAAGATTDASNLLLHSDFSGEIGHVAPRAMYIDWVHAACISPSAEAADLLASWHGLRADKGQVAPLEQVEPSRPSGEPVRRRARVAEDPQPPHKGFRPGDLAMAEKLRLWRSGDSG